MRVTKRINPLFDEMQPRFLWTTCHRLLLQSLANPRIPNPRNPTPKFNPLLAHSSSSAANDFKFDEDDDESFSVAQGSKIVRDLHVEVARDRQRERDARVRAGLDTADIDVEEEEDYIGVGPIIEKLEREKLKPVKDGDLYLYEEPTDSDSSDDNEDQEEMLRREGKTVERKIQRFKELMDGFTASETMEDAFMWMSKIDRFEEKHFKLRLEYRVIGELMNRMKVAEGKEKFLLQVKLNRAIRLVEWKEKFDPSNPANYGDAEIEDGPPGSAHGEDEKEVERKLLAGKKDSDDEEDEEKSGDDEDSDSEEFDDVAEKDEALLQKLNAIDNKIEEKLAALEYTFGKKGRLLEEEIKELADERNLMTEERKKSVVRKGFDSRLIDLNRTCKVTKGGQVIKFTAIVVCGNYNGVIGYAKARSSTVPMALQKAREKSFQNLHYVERHEEHTIAHAVQTHYKKTKVYLWPAKTKKGMSAGRTVQAILHLAGFKNIKSKVIGSRNPHNTVKAVFQALNAIDSPKDIQEKFGRVVVEKHLV